MGSEAITWILPLSLRRCFKFPDFAKIHYLLLDDQHYKIPCAEDLATEYGDLLVLSMESDETTEKQKNTISLCQNMR